MRHIWLFLVLLCLGSCQPVSETNSLQRILQAGVLKVGTMYGLSTYYNGANRPEGFEFELALGFAEFLGVKLEVYPFYSYRELFSPLDNGDIDLIAAGMTQKIADNHHYLFGPSYQTISHKLVFKQGDKRPRDIDDLDGELMVTANSIHATLLSLEQELHPKLRWQETDDQDMEELLEWVLEDRIDYTITDSNLLSIIRRRYPELSIGFTVRKAQPVSWVLKHHADDALYAAVIEYFGQVKSNGTLASLEDKYFGHVRQFNYVDTTLFMDAAKNTLPKYENDFRKYAGELDWRLLAAMSYQESHWNPRAKSPTGVRGMMMLTLPTARDWGVKSRLDAEQSIRGGTQYFASLLRRIPDRITYPDRIWFALAAYNIGLGHLEDARVITERMGANPDLWVDVKRHLPLLRQKRHYKNTRYGYARGNEAVTYVANIRRYYDSLVYLYENTPLSPETTYTEAEKPQ
ncbi:MAG: membrane-bound lytic murein transglycosylase MltF [Aestuariibacter sp.]